MAILAHRPHGVGEGHAAPTAQPHEWLHRQGISGLRRRGDLAARAATGHRSGGIPIEGRWHGYPENAAASLWSTPSDLARFARAVMQSLEGAPDALLSRASAEQMVAPQNREGTHGLGFEPGDDGGDKVYFLHSGANEGFRCVIVVYPRFGQAVAIMTNGDGGEALWRELPRSVSVEYGWV